mgnify:CR=1 FL=1
MSIYRFNRYELYNRRNGNPSRYVGSFYAEKNLGTRANQLLTARRNTTINFPRVTVGAFTPHPAKPYDLRLEGIAELANQLLDQSGEKVATAFDIEMPRGFRSLRRLWPVASGMSKSLLTLTARQTVRGQWINTLESAATYTLRAPATSRAGRRCPDPLVKPTVTKIAQRAGAALAKG